MRTAPSASPFLGTVTDTPNPPTKAEAAPATSRVSDRTDALMFMFVSLCAKETQVADGFFRHFLTTLEQVVETTAGTRYSVRAVRAKRRHRACDYICSL